MRARADGPRIGLGAVLRLVGVAVVSVAVMGGLVTIWFRARLKESLPVIDGKGWLPGLSAEVTIARDADGVPTIRGANLVDVARALGFAHGQDRFFQMDLARRRAAGELAALVGKAALPLDRQARMHPFRKLAEEDYRRASPEERAILRAYADGVNAGVGSLKAKPFEYIVLRARPEPWRPEDAYLIGYTMALTLQDGGARYLRDLAEVQDLFGNKALEFFCPFVGPNDAALDGSAAPLGPLPVPGVFQLQGNADVLEVDPPAPSSGGSNAFAVAGRFTGTGAAMLANDMHLSLAVPNIWYRAQLEWPGHRVVGVTLPGAPAVVAGSNGHVAWGFTDAHVGTGDLLLVTPTTLKDYYDGPQGVVLPVLERVETIDVAGSGSVTETYRSTIWGPIVGSDSNGRWYVYHWEEDDPAAANLGFGPLYDARTTDQALAAAHGLGIPDENIVVADAQGKIGWTIAGLLPRRVGYRYNGRLPVTWVFGDRKWDGWLPGREVPVVEGRPYLWSANQRMIGGPGLQLLGDDGYEAPFRAAQIRDDLAVLTEGRGKVEPKNLLAIELDDRAIFLRRWRQLLVSILPEDVAPPGSERARLRAAVERWNGRADADAVGYTLVRRFRSAVCALVLDPLFAPLVARDPGFDWRRLRYEDGLWQLIQDKPEYLLNPKFKSWDDLLVSAADTVIRQLKEQGVAIDRARWGRFNRLEILHPFGRVFPRLFTGWLDMPVVEMPGGRNLPRIQAPSFGASERLVVSPGHEDQGLFEMPTGQSGHPLSPFYRSDEDAWVRGAATPLLPGPARHWLILEPLARKSPAMSGPEARSTDG